jgi:hypothetical protein
MIQHGTSPKPCRLGLDMNPAKLFNILRGPSSKACEPLGHRVQVSMFYVRKQRAWSLHVE